MKKITIGEESSRDLTAHSIGNADGEIWLWGPSENSYGEIEYGVNEGRHGCAYTVASFYTRKEAVAEVRKRRQQRSIRSLPVTKVDIVKRFKIKEIAEYAIGRLSEFDENSAIHGCDLHNEIYNTDYYIMIPETPIANQEGSSNPESRTTKQNENSSIYIRDREQI